MFLPCLCSPVHAYGYPGALDEEPLVESPAGWLKEGEDEHKMSHRDRI
jgi:hypothetical protein